MLPISTSITLDVQTKIPKNAQAGVAFVTRDRKFSGDMTMVLETRAFECAERMIKLEIVQGKLKEVDFDLLEGKDRVVRRIYVAGLGPADKLDAEVVRQAAGAVVRTARKHRVKHFAMVPPVVSHSREALGTQAMVEGLLLAAFQYREYRGSAGAGESEDERENGRTKDEPIRVTILSSKNSEKANREAMERGRLLADAQNFARTIAFRPGNDVNPPRLAQIARSE